MTTPPMDAERMRFPGTRIDVPSGGATLAAYTGGRRDPGAPTLLFLHAGVSDSRLWSAQFATFGATHRVAAWDRRGFGATTPVDESFSSVEDLWRVMDALAIERAILIGCSQGGRIALDATLERPERVAGLVLVAAAIGGAPEEPHDPRLDPLIAAYDAAQQAGDLDGLNHIEAQVWLDGPFSPEGRVGGAARALFLAMNRSVLEAPKIGTFDVPDTAWNRLDEIAVPTLVVWGPLDTPSVVANMEHAARTIPGARAHRLDGVAHLPSLEAPDRFDAALATFLNEATFA